MGLVNFLRVWLERWGLQEVGRFFTEPRERTRIRTYCVRAAPPHRVQPCRPRPRRAKNLSRAPDPGGLVVKYVPGNSRKSMFSGQIDFEKEVCSPPSGQGLGQPGGGTRSSSRAPPLSSKISTYKTRANSAHVRQSAPAPGPGLRVKVLKTCFKVFRLRSAAVAWTTAMATFYKGTSATVKPHVCTAATGLQSMPRQSPLGTRHNPSRFMLL